MFLYKGIFVLEVITHRHLYVIGAVAAAAVVAAPEAATAAACCMLHTHTSNMGPHGHPA